MEDEKTKKAGELEQAVIDAFNSNDQKQVESVITAIARRVQAIEIDLGMAAQ